MQLIRPKIKHIQSTSNTWPHYFVDVKVGDVFIIFDMRRYENNTLKLAEMAFEKDATIILFTDQWRSPIHRIAEQRFGSRIVVPSASDSAITPLLLLVTMISTVQAITRVDTKDRIEALEEMFDHTRLFRKFT